MAQKNVIEKLRGRENYATWKIAAQSYLTINGYWSCTKVTVSEAATADVLERHEKALSELFLLIDSSLYSYIDGLDSIKLAWEALSKAFSDTGTCRKVHLLQQWINTKLNDCNGMEEYVNKMTNSWASLKSLGFKIDEEVGASVLLAGLPNEYKTMILGLEQQKTNLTLDFVKTLLLQGSVVDEMASSSSGAFLSKGKKKFNKVKCFNCGGPHYARHCKKKAPQKNNGKNKQHDDQHVLFSALLANDSSDTWYVDSGATSHMTGNNSNLENLRELSQERSITVANGGTISVKATGDIMKSVKTTSGNNKIIIKNCEFVPDLCTNLLSVAQMVKNKNTVVFNENGCFIYNSAGKVIATADLVNNLFKLNTMPSVCALSAKSTKIADDVMLFHRRMGHLSLSGMQRLQKFADIDVTSINCVVCAEGKQCRNKFKKKVNNRASDFLALVHSDVCGPMSVNSMGGARYYVTFIDDYSRKVFVYIIKNKSQVFDCFVKFKNLVETQMNKKVKILRSDNGTEYCNKRFENFCVESGIVHQKSCVYTPEQNGLAERFNRTIMERARCLLFDSKLSRCYWAESVLTAVKLINSSCSSSINAVPDEIWYKKPVDFSRFKVFGCRAMVHVPKEKRKKLDKKAIECIFLGYSDETKGYRLMVKSTKKILISRDVMFFENCVIDDEHLDNYVEFPMLITERKNECTELREENSLSESAESREESVNDSIGIDMNDSTIASSSVNNIGDISTIDLTNSISDTSNISSSTMNGTLTNSHTSDESSFSQADDTHDDPNFDARAAVNRAERPVTRMLHALNPFNFALLTVSEALNCDESEQWKLAMKEELDAHKTNQTWELVDLPAGRVPIKSKWVFKRKTDAQGNVIRYKARLVGKGCSQKEGIDFDEIYAPVVRYASIRYLVALAAQFNLEIYQMDAITAFLQGDLNETIYMLQPEYHSDGTKKVCLLRKSIYGLKQASRVWNMKLRGVLVSAGYKSSQMDPCIFFKIDDGNMIFVAIYVDDVLYFTNSSSMKFDLQTILTSNFKMKDMGVADYCVGLHITRDRSRGIIYLDQRKYVEEVLERFNMTNCKAIDTPSDPNQRLRKGDASDPGFNDESIPYQQAVGSLMYLTQGTRPDLAYAINNVCRFNTCYTKEHWTAVKRIMRYLRGTSNLKLSFRKIDNHSIHGYTDADWGADVNDRKSVTGFVFIRSGGAISWCSKKQPTVALSTAEAEYMALSACTQEAMWLKQLEDEIFSVERAINIFCDNQSAICIAENNGYSSRSKHIDLRHHFVREKVMNKLCILHYISTDKNVADVLTKALVKQKFAAFANLFGLI